MVLVPRPEVWPEALVWEHWVQDARSLDNSWPQGRLITESSHGDLCLNPWRSSTQLPAAPSAEHLTKTTNKTGTQNHPTAHRLPKLTDTQKHTTWHGPAHQREKTQFHPPEGRHQSLPLGSLHKPLDKPHHRGQRTEARGTMTLQPRERRPQIL